MREALAAAAAVAALAGSLVALRVLELREAFSDRTAGLVVMAAVAAFVTMLTALVVASAVARAWPGWLRASVAAPLIAGGWIGALALVFALHIRILAGHTDSEAFSEGWFREIVGSGIGAMGLATPVGRKYVLPWPAPLVGALGGIAVAIVMRERHRRP